MRKIEIIIKKRDAEDVCRDLLAAGASGYTVLDTHSGSGVHAGQTSPLAWADGSNVYIIVLCDVAQTDAILNSILGHVNRPGSIAFMSEVQPLT